MKRKGFTLIELVVTMSIIGILGSLSFIQYSNVQENAKVIADDIQIENLFVAAELALLDGHAEDSITVEYLKDKGYISNIPDPISKIGEFEITINNKEILIGINEDI